MSDVSKTNELIEQLRAFGNADFMGESGIPGFRLLWDAADALESATRVPEQGEANAAIERMRAIHQREVIAVHPGIGEEAWCPACQEHWPCSTATALDGAPEPVPSAKYACVVRERYGATGVRDYGTDRQAAEACVTRCGGTLMRSDVTVTSWSPLPVEGEKP